MFTANPNPLLYNPIFSQKSGHLAIYLGISWDTSMDAEENNEL